MGQRRLDSMSTQHLGRDAFFADAMDFRTSWNISFNHYYFYFTVYYSNHHFFAIRDQHKWKS